MLHNMWSIKHLDSSQTKSYSQKIHMSIKNKTIRTFNQFHNFKNSEASLYEDIEMI